MSSVLHLRIISSSISINFSDETLTLKTSAITMVNREAFPGGFRLPARLKLRLFNKEAKKSYSGGNLSSNSSRQSAYP